MAMLFYLLLLLFTPIFSMEQDGRQLLICPARKAIVQAQVSQASKKTCVFCDSVSLAKNYIVSEDKDSDVRVMMNKFPYFDFDQGYHLLIMPLSHKLFFNEFSSQELSEQLKTALRISSQLYDDFYSLGYFINLSEGGGQSVPHLHSHIQAFMERPLSLPEMMKHKNSQTNNIEHAFECVKSKLNSLENELLSSCTTGCTKKDCYSCSIIHGNSEDDEKNFVIARGTYNVVCIAHFPQIAAHIVVIPYNHTHALKDLTTQELLENIQLSLSLLPALKEYTQKNIRQWTGDNIYIKSLSAKSRQEDKENYHIYTSVMPRTTIGGPSGTICHHSCKLDFDAPDLYGYLKAYMNGQWNDE